VRYIAIRSCWPFSTASSEAAYPRTLEALDRFGVPPRIASFVLPLGYSFNLDGSMMYMTFATIFIAQAYGIELTLGTQILMLLTLMITSKGVAGVPRASLVVITATLNQFNIPEAGLLLILAVDHFSTWADRRPTWSAMRWPARSWRSGRGNSIPWSRPTSIRRKRLRTCRRPDLGMSLSSTSRPASFRAKSRNVVMSRRQRFSTSLEANGCGGLSLSESVRVRPSRALRHRPGGRGCVRANR
jgi:hypothetical protein